MSVSEKGVLARPASGELDHERPLLMIDEIFYRNINILLPLIPDHPAILMKETEETMNRNRYLILDEIRGLAILNMIAYHACWDLVYMFGQNWAWYQSDAAYIWQQGICWTFIFLSGFCLPLGKRKVRRGLTVFVCGLVITAVTLLVMYDDRVIFGVLTLIGSAMLLTAFAEPLLKKCPPAVGFTVSFLLFLLTKRINSGYLGFGTFKLLALPKGLYRNLFTTYLGFQASGFYSTDYFSLIPWLFLFLAGFYLYALAQKKDCLRYLTNGKLKPLQILGQHSLPIYMVHQVLLYAVFSVVFYVI
ncbi:MAG: DUF1624 domain-containing protein [Lachnospiraceae bacterium]|nr:DUF1624 domain-containing protein [Lachnospiraceae bacterium]